MDWPVNESPDAYPRARYLSHLEFLLSPDLIVIEGGISARHEDFLPHLHLDTPIVPAQLPNAAGIIGAARHAYCTAPPLP